MVDKRMGTVVQITRNVWAILTVSRKKTGVWGNIPGKQYPNRKKWNNYLAASDDLSQVAILTANTYAYIHRHKRSCVSSSHLCATSPITLTFAPSQFTWSLQEMMVEDLATWHGSGIHNWTSFKKLTLGIWLERNPPPELQACCSRNYYFFAPSTGT